MTDLMKDFTDIDEVGLNQLREAEKTGDGVQLPFPVAYAWAYSGQANQKNVAATHPVLYFGGWAADAVKIGELVEDGVVPDMPDKWVAFEATSRKGTTWNGLGARTITAAIIASRTRWEAKDGSTFGPEYDADAGLVRQKIQVLALLYNKQKPWAYGVLSASGYQVNFLKDAVSAWYKAIKPHLKALNAERLPMSAFAITLGTQGDKIKTQMVGRGDAQSPITPIEAVIPADLSAEKVGNRFISAAYVRMNSERLAQAQEWLAAWKTPPAKRANGEQREAERADTTEIPF